MGRSPYLGINFQVKSLSEHKIPDLLAATTSSSLSNSHRPPAPDKAASFKSLYLNRPNRRCRPVVPTGAVQIQH